MNRIRYFIGLGGCDGSTGMVAYLTPAEAVLMESLSALSRRVGGGCQPVLFAVPEWTRKSNALETEIDFLSYWDVDGEL